MATPRRKPTSNSSAKKAPVRKVTVKAMPAKSVPGSKGGFTAQVREAQKKAAPEQKARTVDPNSFSAIVKSLRAIYAGKTVHLLDIPWDGKALARTLGAEFNERTRLYVYAGDIVPLALTPYQSEDFSYLRWIEDQVNGRILPAQKPEGEMFTLRPHQKEAADAISKFSQAGWRGFMLADSTGLGKSLAALVGASQAAEAKGFTPQKKAKMLLLCPKGAIPHWKNTIRHANIRNMRFLVVNYDQYKKLLTVPKSATEVKKTKTKNKHITQSGKPFILWDFIIADESHKLKNITSQRTQAFQTIAQYNSLAADAPFVLWLSATLAQNPLEIHYLAPIIGQAAKKNLTMETWPEWLKANDFAVTKSNGGNWSWVKPDSPDDVIKRTRQREDVQKLADMLFSPKAPSIRRKPEDIAGWPSVNRIAMPVQLGVESQRAYDKLWTEFRKLMNMTTKGKNPKSVLVEQLRFSQKASLLRVPQTVDNIVDMLEGGYQVAVSVRFIESLEAIKSSLKALGIEASEFSGRTFINNEKERLLFQKGVNKVILFTVEEAVSFHAKEQLPDGSTASPFPRATFIHDMRYSALSMTQIIGRTHRDGQLSNAYFMYAEGTVEKKILDIMLNKMENMSVLSGDEEEDAIMGILESVL